MVVNLGRISCNKVGMVLMWLTITMATPISDSKFSNNLIYASKPPAEPPTQTIGNIFSASLIVVYNNLSLIIYILSTNNLQIYVR